MITIKGIVIDVGMIEGGRGIKIETEGEEVAITGLTTEECQDMAGLLGETVEISIKQAAG